MTEPTWRFLYLAQAREKWIADFRPSFDDAARVRAWQGTVEDIGFPEGTVFWDDENFVARVPGTRVVVSGIAVPFERLLIIRAIRPLGLVS